MDWKAHYKDLRSLNWAVLLVFSSVSYLLMAPARTTGVILGGLIAIANFNILQHTIRRAFGSGGLQATSKASIIAKYYLRLLALGVVVLVLITTDWVDPIGLAIGLSTVVLSIFCFGIRKAIKMKTGEAT
ncbi:MAG: ATP synthase subunit I [Deltaproteobacteria bacterium]|nr:ATP synthase subunit I [Deltaproteobacteria bacterium]